MSNDLLRSYFLLGSTPSLSPGANTNYAQLFTGLGGSSTSYSYISQKIPQVRQFDSKTLKGTFWAQAGIDGQKCSVSWNIYTNGAYAGDSYQEFTLTDEWAEYEYSFDIYSLSGKGDVPNDSVDDYLELKFWFDVGASSAAEGGGIGNQEGSLRLSNITAYCVDTVNKDIDYEVNARSYTDEFLLCQRYYNERNQESYLTTFSSNALLRVFHHIFPVQMRDTPSASWDYSGTPWAGSQAESTSKYGWRMVDTRDAGGEGGWSRIKNMHFDAEF